MSLASHSLNQALTPKKSNIIPALLLIIGLIVCIAAAAYGYIESRRTEKVVIAARDITYGRQIVADDLAVIELPLHRPVQLAGIVDPNAVIGQYAARQIGPNDIVQPTMLFSTPPEDPVYPNGSKLGRDMVPVPFALEALGPITDKDRVNIGFTTTDAALCDRTAADVPVGTVRPPVAPIIPTASEGVPQPRAYACRLLSSARIIYIDGGTAYLEMTPAQAHIMWALQASGVAMWGERYGALSSPLMSLDRLDAGQITLPDLTGPITDTLRIEPSLAANPEGAPSSAIPGSQTRIPGTNTSRPGETTALPGSNQPATNETPATVQP